MKLLSVVASGGAAAILACGGAHEEMTPAIAVQPGAAARAMALLGHGGPNDPAPGVAPPADADATEAEGGASADGYGYEFNDERGGGM